MGRGEGKVKCGRIRGEGKVKKRVYAGLAQW